MALVSANPLHFSILHARYSVALRRVLEPHGYKLEIVYLDDFPEPGSAERHLRARGVRGLIVLAPEDPEPYRNFDWSQFSAVQLMTSADPPVVLPIIRHDAYQNLLYAGKRVLAAKPRSAAIQLVKSKVASVTDKRLQSAAVALQQLWEEGGIEDRRIIMIPPEFESNVKELTRLKDGLPEVLIVQNSTPLTVLESLGMRVPEDIQLIVLNLPEDSTLAGYCLSYEKSAILAWEMLDEYIRNDVRPPLVMPEVKVIQDPWHPGTSFYEPEEPPATG